MKSIELYLKNFFRTHKMNVYYTMRFPEMLACIQAAQKLPAQTIGTVFDYGYVKGYRAAMSEIKKGGVPTRRKSH